VKILPGLVLAVVFVLTRLPALQLQTQDSDINLYSRYAAEWHEAAASGQSFYTLHRERIESEIASASPERAPVLREYTSVEYPPLAVAVMALPAALVDRPFEEKLPSGLPPRYAGGYVAVMALFDLCVLLVVILLVRRLYPVETPWQQCERCLVYLLASWPLYGVIYARLDVGIALAVAASLVLLVGRGKWWLSFLVLALGIHFKLMPAVLAPLWIVASLPVAVVCGPWRRLGVALVQRTAVLAGFGIAILAAFWLWQGPGILGFLGYHKDRGLEIESTWSSLLLLLRPLGFGWEVYHSHGSVNVRTPFSPVVAGLATATMGLLVLGISVMFLIRVRRQRSTETISVAQSQPRLVAGFALLLLLVSIVANKVLSPQYLLWALPLVPLIDFATPARRLYFAGTLAACYLTMRIFPDCFVGDIVYTIGRHGDLPLFDGPTAYGAFLLLTRNALCVALTTALAIALLRRARAAVPETSYLHSSLSVPTIRSVA
jgi:hypothetical protein